MDETSQDEENGETGKETEKSFFAMYSTLHIGGMRILSYNCVLMLKCSNFSW